MNQTTKLIVTAIISAIVSAPVSIFLYKSEEPLKKKIPRRGSSVEEFDLRDVEHLEKEIEKERLQNKKLMEINSKLNKIQTLDDEKIKFIAHLNVEQLQLILSGQDAKLFQEKELEFANLLKQYKELQIQVKENIQLKAELEQLNKKNIQINGHVLKENEEIIKLKSEIDQLNKASNDRDRVIVNLEKQVQNSNSNEEKMKQLQSELISLKEEKENLKLTLSEKEKAYSNLEQETKNNNETNQLDKELEITKNKLENSVELNQKFMERLKSVENEKKLIQDDLDSKKERLAELAVEMAKSKNLANQQNGN